MSFLSELMDADRLPATLVTLGIVEVATDVYMGRTARGVQSSNDEVWVEPVGAETAGRGLQALETYRMRLHVISGLRNKGSAKAGVEQLSGVEAKAATLRRALSGARPWSDLDELVALQARIESHDEDPEGPSAAVVSVDALVREVLTAAAVSGMGGEPFGEEGFGE